MRSSTPVLAAAALALLAGCGTASRSATHPTSAPAALAVSAATTGNAAATLTTMGTGTVSGTPNVMTLQIGVQNTATHVAAALSANNATSAAVQAALVRDGVAVADIQTAQLELYPQQTGNTVTGYQVADVVTATMRDLSKAGTVIDDALAAAGDAGRLDGVSFSLADDSPLLAQARQQAVGAARTDAEQLAGAGGVRLLGLRSLTDQTDQPEDYLSPASSAGSASGGTSAVPVQPGTQQTTVQVTAVWAVTS